MNPITFSALAEENRFHIVELLRDNPRPVNELVTLLHLRQPQVSKHLKVLADAGLVAAHPVANQRVYSLQPKHFKEMDVWLEKYRVLWSQRFEALDRVLEEEKSHSASR